MKKMICIVCPNGCELEIDDSLQVSGNLCSRGAAFAIQEMTDPRRSVSTTCRTVFTDIPVVPVRTSQEVPLAIVKEIVQAVNRTVIDRPMNIGETVIENVLDTGADVILCTSRLKEVKYD